MEATQPAPALDDVREAAARLAEHDAQREPLITARDRALVQARRQGATWVQMQTAADLSQRGLSKALERAGA